MTFSIVGFDPNTKELGVAVQSKFLASGAIAPWAKAGVGAIATQAIANTTYGPIGLNLLKSGKTVEQTMEILTDNDSEKAIRQVGIVDKHGNATTFTGEKCDSWAGGITGKHFAAQGNILVSSKTVKAMGNAFENTKGKLAFRLIKALEAGQLAGGDSRGQQSAGLLVVKENAGYGGHDDRAVDLRVDDHQEPINELMRLYGIYTSIQKQWLLGIRVE